MLIYGVMVHLLYVRVGAVVVVVVLLWEISLHRVACISMCDRDRGYYLQSFDNYPPRLEVKEERGRESFFSLSDNPHSSPARRNRLSLNAAPPTLSTLLFLHLHVSLIHLNKTSGLTQWDC